MIRALEGLDGVHKADASYADSTASAQYDPDKVTPEELAQALKAAGYAASVAGEKPG